MQSFRCTFTLHRGANLYKLIRADDILSATLIAHDYASCMIGSDVIRKIEISAIVPHELPAIAVAQTPKTLGEMLRERMDAKLANQAQPQRQHAAH